jgi:RNA polymerase sigma-70 factor (ECF subfamily)
MTHSPDTLKTLHEEYHPMVRQMCLGYVKGDEEMAKDLTQEVFISIWNALPRFEGRSSYKTWIYRITVNTCISHVRKKVPLKETSMPDLPSEDGQENDPTDQLLHAIGKLPEVERLLIMMVLDELSYSEIAEVTGITEGNLRVRIHRIKNKLKIIMENGRI